MPSSVSASRRRRAAPRDASARRREEDPRGLSVEKGARFFQSGARLRSAQENARRACGAQPDRREGGGGKHGKRAEGAPDPELGAAPLGISRGKRLVESERLRVAHSSPTREHPFEKRPEGDVRGSRRRRSVAHRRRSPRDPQPRRPVDEVPGGLLQVIGRRAKTGGLERREEGGGLEKEGGRVRSGNPPVGDPAPRRGRPPHEKVVTVPPVVEGRGKRRVLEGEKVPPALARARALEREPFENPAGRRGVEVERARGRRRVHGVGHPQIVASGGGRLLGSDRPIGG